MMKRTERISRTKIDTVCAEHKFYTNGTAAAYRRMLNIADMKDHSIDEIDSTIEKIAADIFRHSDNKSTGRHGWSDEYCIDAIACILVNEAVTRWLELE